MATNTYTEWHPHIGSVWARAVALWSGYIGDSTVSFVPDVDHDGSNNIRFVVIILTGPVDTNTYKLYDASSHYGWKYPLEWVATRPGWGTMPLVQPITQAGRTTITDWTNNMTDLRRAIWVTWCAAALGTGSLETRDMIFPTSKVGVRYFSVQNDSEMITDQTMVTVATQSAAEYLYNNGPMSFPSNDTPPTVYASSGGGSVDLAPVVAALEEIASTETTYVANNGANIFSLRSKVLTGP